MLKFKTFVAALLGFMGVAQADIVRYPSPLPIAQTVEISGDVTTYYISGQVPPVVDKAAPVDSRQAYGDMTTQTVGALNRIKDILVAHGLTMGDVVKMQVYLVTDTHNNHAMDLKGFMEGYTQFFGGNQTNLPARSVFGVSALVNPGYLVEIEVIAAKDNK